MPTVLKDFLAALSNGNREAVWAWLDEEPEAIYEMIAIVAR